jgi:hypothetical protein
VRNRRWRARAVGAALLVAWAPALQAQEAPGDPPGDAPGEAPSAPAPGVSVHAAADEPARAALDERLRPRLRALGVDLTIDVATEIDVDAVINTPAARDGAPLAQVWLDARSPTEATVFLIPRRADRVLGRRITLGAGLDEVALAELVYIVERAVIALLASQPVGVPREELDPSLRPAAAPPPPPPAVVATAVVPPPTAAPAAAPRTASFHAGVFAEGESWAAGRDAVAAAGALAGLEHVGPWGRLGVALDVTLHREIVGATPQGTLRLDGGGGHVWLALGRTFDVAGTGRLLVGPGLAVNEVGATPPAGASGVTARPRTDVDAILGVLLRWDIPVGDRWGLFVATGADVAFVAARYTAVAGTSATPLLTTWPVRPLVRLGFVVGGR